MVDWIISLPRKSKRIIAVATDLLVLPIVLWLAFCLRLDQLYVPELRVITVALLTICATLAIFLRLGLYRAVIRFAGTKLLTSVFIGISLSALALAVFGFILHASIPRSVPFIYFGLSVIAIGGTRLSMRSLLKPSNRYPKSERVVIYGAGSAGVQLASALGQGIEYKPIAFLDDDESKQGAILQDLSVHPPNRLRRLIDRNSVRYVFLAISSLSNSEQAKILRLLTKYDVTVKIIPSYADIAGDHAYIDHLRDVEVEDLLGRDAVEPHQDLLISAVSNKSVMVTGAGGSIGSELCRQICKLEPTKLVALEMSEYALYAISQELEGSSVEIVPVLGTVLDRDALVDVLKKQQVQVVYHAAAYKHVPLVESNVISGTRNNVLGTYNAVAASIATKVQNFILISTDKAVRPTNVMGATKRMSELVLQAYADEYQESHTTNFSIVRFGNVLNSSGSVVPLFKRQIRASGPVTVTHPEITRYFMSIPEAVQLVLQSSAMSEGGDVFVLDMGDPVKIADLARTMIRLMGKTLRDDENPTGSVDIQFTGLRPGEKLYEELLLGENCVATEHPMIDRATEHHLIRQQLDDLVRRIIDACDSGSEVKVVEVLATAVQEYAPSSKFMWNETHRAAH